jgi:WD40 repeat protein
VAFSPDGKVVAVACLNYEEHVLLFDADKVEKLKPLQMPLRWDFSGRLTMIMAPSYVHNGFVQFSPDGKYCLAWGFTDYFGVWETATGKLAGKKIRHETGTRVFDSDFSSDGKLLATTGVDNTARIWDFVQGTESAVLKHPNWVFKARFSKDSTRLITACRDGQGRLWDWRAGKVLATFPHADEVADIAFSPDERWVITVSYDLTTRVWDRHTGKPMAPRWPIDWFGLGVAVPPGGDRVLASGYGSRIHSYYLGDLRADPAWTHEDMGAFAEMIASQRIQESGTIVTLTDQEWLARWRTLRAKRPDHFEGMWR